MICHSQLLPLEFLDDLGDKKGEHEEPDGEKDLEGNQLPPVPRCPYLLQGPDEKRKNKSTHDNAEACSQKIIPETNFCKPHAEIHGRKGKIDQPEVENRGKPVSFYCVVILLEPIPYQGRSEFSPQGPPDEKGNACSHHGPDPDVYKAFIWPENRGAQSRKQSATRGTSLNNKIT